MERSLTHYHHIMTMGDQEDNGTADGAQGQRPCPRPPSDAKKMTFCLLLLMMWIVWLVQTGIISPDGVMTTDVIIPPAINVISSVS